MQYLGRYAIAQVQPFGEMDLFATFEQGVGPFGLVLVHAVQMPVELLLNQPRPLRVLDVLAALLP